MKLHIWLLVVTTMLFASLSIGLHAAYSKEYVFSAPPRETLEYGNEVYGPIAAYLSKVTGTRIVYQHQTNWLSYLYGMKNGEYDIVFDGPHFNAWRNRYQGHVPLARIDNLKGKQFKPRWVLVARKGTDMKDLNGKVFCLHAPPNFGTMSTLQILFPNPSRQPYIKEMKGWKKMVKAVYNKENECEFTVSRGKHLKDVDPQRKKIIGKPFAEFVHQGFTAGSNLPEKMIAQMRQALTSPEGRIQMKAFFKRFVKHEKRGLVAYKDSHEYNQPLEIFAQQYLIPMGMLDNTIARSK